nr:ABC transporter permease subunit [Desulfuromonadales bacterium]
MAAAKPRPSLVPLLLAPAMILFLGVFIVPLLGVLFESLGRSDFTLQYYIDVFDDAVLMEVLLRTIVLSLIVTAICLLLGYPIAYVMLQSSGWLQRFIALLIVLPLWTSLLVRTYAWMVILGRKGLVNEALISLGAIDAPLSLLYTRFSVYVGMVNIMLPFMVLPLFAVMRRIDMGLLSAAWSLGASRTKAFFVVFLPLSLPGIVAGSLLVFILSIGFFVTPALLGGLGDTTFVMLIERQVNRLANWPLAAAMSVILLAATLALVIIYNRVMSSNSGGSAMSGKIWVQLISLASLGNGAAAALKKLFHRLFPARPQKRPARRPPRNFPFAKIVAWTTMLLMIFPIIILYPLAFSDAPYLQFPPPDYSTRWFENYFARNDWIRPTIISFEVGLVVMLLGTAIGTSAAVALVRGTFPGKKAAFGLLLSPIIVPTIISAVALYYLFASYGLVGTRTALVLAHLTLAVPFVLVVVASALERVDPALEQAAWTLGATKFATFRKITLPLIRPAVITAALFAFLASFDEVVIAIFLSGVRVKTLPKRMWEGIREEIDPTTAAVAALLVTLSLVLVILAEVLRARGSKRGAAGHDQLVK